MIKPNWTFQLLRLGAGLLLALLIGWWSGYLVLIPGLFLLLYLGWLVYNSLRLFHWLQSWDSDPPESLGMWAEIFDRIAAIQKQNLKRNRQYQEVIDDFEGLADAFPDATLVIDRHDAISWFNDSAVLLLGLKPAVDQGQAVTNLIREPAFADWLAVQDKLQSTLNITCPGNDNIGLQISAIRFRKNQRLLILRDVTDVRNLDRMRHDLVAMSISDPREVEMPDVGLIELEDAETGQRTLVDTADAGFRRRYGEIATERRADLKRRLGAMDVDYVDVRTDEPYDKPLMHFFRRRTRKIH